MTAIDAAAEVAVRPIRFGDPVLIEAIEILDMIDELRALTSSRPCLCCARAFDDNFDRMDRVELRRQLSIARNRAAAKAAGV